MLRADQAVADCHSVQRELATCQQLAAKEKNAMQERLTRSEELARSIQQQVLLETQQRNELEKRYMREKAAMELTFTSRIRELEGECSLTNVRNQDLKRQLEDACGRIAELRNRGETESLKQELSATKGQLESAHATIEKRNREMESLQDKNRQLSQTVQKMQRHQIGSS